MPVWDLAELEQACLQEQTDVRAARLLALRCYTEQLECVNDRYNEHRHLERHEYVSGLFPDDPTERLPPPHPPTQK